jgi:hypothetical protein
MSDQRVWRSSDVPAADWIVTRLADHTYRVNMLLPPGFAAYARILHPVVTETSAGRRLTRWHEIAAPAGLVPLDRDVQFSGLTNQPGVQAPDVPIPGELPEEDLATLADVLARHTAGADHCWFCIWDGYGPPSDDATAEGGSTAVFTRMARPLNRPPIQEPAAGRPQVHGSNGRSYWLYAGPLAAVTTLGLPPSLWWPDDHAWCAATDADLDSTYIGGPSGLAHTLLAHPGIEVLPADLNDPIAPVIDED